MANGCKTTCNAETGKKLYYLYRIAMATVLVWTKNRDAAIVAVGVILLGLLFVISYVKNLTDKTRKFRLYYWFLLPLECIFLLFCVAHANDAVAYTGAGIVMFINVVVCVVHQAELWCYSANYDICDEDT